MNVEEALRAICEKAAVLRFLSNTAAHDNGSGPDSAVLSGIGSICEDIEALTTRVKHALDATTLDVNLSTRARG